MKTGRGNRARPIVGILDPSVAMTGALMAARREASLLEDRARFVLLTSDRNALPDEAMPEFERIVRIPLRPLRKTARSVLGYAPGVLRSARRLARELKGLGCERLQVNDFYLADGAAARLFGYRGRIVTWVRIDPANFGAAGRLWLGLARRTSDAVVAVSRFIADRLPFAPTAIVFDPPPETAMTRPEGSQFLFVGNYVEGKGQDMAIRAFHRIADDFPQASLQFHGSTMGLAKNEHYRACLQRLAADGAGAERIRIDGYCGNLDIVSAASVAAINCSRSESYSLTCLEASARGLPVIATRCGGPEEIIVDGETGFLVRIGDVDALEQRMRAILEDSSAARRMGTAGRARVYERFGPDRFRAQLIDLLAL